MTENKITATVIDGKVFISARTVIRFLEEIEEDEEVIEFFKNIEYSAACIEDGLPELSVIDIIKVDD